MAYSLAEIKKNRTTGLSRPNQGGEITRSDGSSSVYQPSAPQKTGLARTQPRPNLGGTITRGGTTQSYAPSPGYDPKGGSAGGVISRPNPPSVKISDNVTMTPPTQRVVAPSPPEIRSKMTPSVQLGQPAALQPALDTPGDPVMSPTTDAAPQTESANPLSGDGNAQPDDTTDAVNPAKAMGFSSRGAGPAAGQDQNTGGSGQYARKFSSAGSAKIYDNYIKKIFG